MRKNIKSFQELIKINKQELLNDSKAIEKIEKRIEKRHEIKN
ncbi:FbpB family small basic protein [Bacillus sp. M6-12]|nr:FbpB family small basic protein [Bacillus sp. M6-12]PLS14913.1 FbpB family small basic protein [Bacillus sp. M6-12]